MTNKKTSKKLLLSLGMVTAVALPLATAIACGTDEVSKLNTFAKGLVAGDFAELKTKEAKDVTPGNIITIIQAKAGYSDLDKADQDKFTTTSVTVKANETAPTILVITISKDLTGGDSDKTINVTGMQENALNVFAKALVAADFTSLGQATTEASAVAGTAVIAAIKAKTGYDALSDADKALFTSTNITAVANTTTHTTLDITITQALTGGTDKIISVEGFKASLTGFVGSITAADFATLEKSTTEAKDITLMQITDLLAAKDSYTLLSTADQGKFIAANITLAVDVDTHTTLDITLGAALTGGATTKISVTEFMATDTGLRADAKKVVDDFQAKVATELGKGLTGTITIDSSMPEVDSYVVLTSAIAATYGVGDSFLELFDTIPSGLKIKYIAAHDKLNTHPDPDETGQIKEYFMVQISKEIVLVDGITPDIIIGSPTLVTFDLPIV